MARWGRKNTLLCFIAPGLLACILAGHALTQRSLSLFCLAAAMLGIGWNFLFISGTALLPTAHEPGEQYRAQALNDFAVFSSQAVASLCAGLAISYLSWHSMLLLCLAVMVGLLFAYRRPL